MSKESRFFLLFCASAGLAAATVFTVPPGLNPGDPYRLTFITSNTRNATSTNIADYNTFVNDAANAPGSYLEPLGGVWKAIASTAAVTALTNIGGPNGTPIYRLDGTLVANGTADLFDGSILAAIFTTELDAPSYGSAWTGTQADGTQYGVVFPLGSDLPGMGVSYITDDRWIGYTRGDPLDLRPLYGISDVLYAPGTPEPQSVVLFLSGGFALIFAARRSARQRSEL